MTNQEPHQHHCERRERADDNQVTDDVGRQVIPGGFPLGVGTFRRNPFALSVCGRYGNLSVAFTIPD